MLHLRRRKVRESVSESDTIIEQASVGGILFPERERESPDGAFFMPK